MKMCRSITPGAFAVLLVIMAIPASVAQAYPSSVTSPVSNGELLRSAKVVKIASYYSEAGLSDVDCIGNGASCVGYLNGPQGEVHVTNNVGPHYYWRFKLTCGFGGDQYSGENAPSADTVISRLTCKFGAPAKHWNVLVDYRP
jgi:hypothetical protein